MAYLHREPIEPSAAKLKSLFMRDPDTGCFQISELLDLMMEPSHQAFVERQEDLAGWVKALMTTEKSFEEFCSKASAYDKSPLCGCVWTKDFVAYRCKTCATSPCMSICAACFERGNHKGHEYNIFRSEAGGACDCGDASVMSRAGFCERHGSNRVVPDDVPEELLRLPKVIMERTVIMLLHNLRYMAKTDIIGALQPERIPEPVSETMDVLIDVIKCGSAVRTWLADLLLSEEYYEGLNANKHFGGIVTEKEKNFHSLSLQYLKESMKKLPKCPVPEEISYIVDFLRSNLVYKNLLQEFTFWLCRFQFPKTLILFLLNMLPDERIKLQLSRYFVHHYIFIPPSLVEPLDVEEYSNRIVHISVQLFSNSDLAFLLAKEEYLLEIFMMSMNYMVTRTLVDSKTSDADFHQIVQVTGSGMLSNAYWAIVSDFVNCLGHHHVANLFLQNEFTLQIWMRVFLCFSGMDTISRQIGFHVEYDPDNALIGFYTEREACAATLWVMLDVLQDPGSVSLTKRMLDICMVTIGELLDVLGVGENPDNDLPFNMLSFHYPVHRYLALFASNAISRQGMKLQDMQIDERLARRLMAHPLQVICATQEIRCDMWVRNGLGVSTKQLAYRQSMFCTFFLDADLFMLQLCSNFMSPDLFIASIFNRCRVTNCLTLDPDLKLMELERKGSIGQPDDEKLPKMLESAFTIMMSVLGIHSHLGISDEEVIEEEVLAILSVQNFTHSNLTGRIPQCHDLHAGEKSKRFKEPLVSTISRLARKVEGDAMTQTVYTLKAQSWEKYNPIFTQHRALYKRDIQRAHTNYFKHLQQANKVGSGTLESSVWPPYRPIRISDDRFAHLGKILNCRTFHSIIFVVLYKYLQQHSVVTEQCLIMCLTLLEAALYASSVENLNFGTKSDNLGFDPVITNLFDCDNMAYNIRKMIREVQVIPEKVESGDSDQQHPDEFMDEFDAPQNEEMPDQFVAVNESIISMLIKIHEKYSGTSKPFTLPADFSPSLEQDKITVHNGASVTKRILLLAASKSTENHMVIIALRPSEDSHPSGTSGANSKDDDERRRRKEKAQEMQRRLLRDFADKQRKFLEQAFKFDQPDDDMEEGTSETNKENKYYCVICGSHEEKTIQHSGTGSQIMCLIGLAQSSALLGHRKESDEPMSIALLSSTATNARNCRTANKELHENLKQKFPLEIHEPSIGHSIGWDTAPYVSTCGHHVHATCFEQYVNWVRRDLTGYLRFEDGIGFLCPLCRQTSNIAIPCNITNDRHRYWREEKHSPSSSGQASLDGSDQFHRTVGTIKSVIGDELIDAVPSSAGILEFNGILDACLKSLEGIHSQNIISQNTDTGQLSTRAMLRGQLEYNLCQLGGTLLHTDTSVELSAVKRNLPIGPLFHVTAKTLKVNFLTANRKYIQTLWQNLTEGVFDSTASNRCPLLFKDPFSLMLEICLAIYPFSIEEFQTVTRLLYNLCLVQSLIHVSCKFSAEEQSAWEAKLSDIVKNGYKDSEIDCLLGHVIHNLPKSLFNGNKMNWHQFSPSQLFTSTVWTKQSVENTVTQFCLHFMRLSALLQFHIFINIAATQPFTCAAHGEDEFFFLAQYLGFSSDSSTELDSISPGIFTKWAGSAKVVIDQWFKEIQRIIVEDRSTSFKLLSEHYFWNQPTLVTLPDDFTKLFAKFREIVCPICKNTVNEPCVCMLCGELICYRGMCHENQSPDGRSAANHAKKCGNGTIILLHINRTTVLVIRGQRSCEWGTLYLDDHGEEDRGWRRGRRLTLRRQRLRVLQHHWVNHLFDSVCSGWRKHRNAI